MTPLDLKKIQAEFKRVDAAKEEMEVRVLERMDEVAKLQEHIKIQQEKLVELKTRLDEVNNSQEVK